METLGAFGDRSLEEPNILMANNFVSDRGDGMLRLNHLKPSNSSGATHFGGFTEISNKRQQHGMKGLVKHAVTMKA